MLLNLENVKGINEMLKVRESMPDAIKKQIFMIHKAKKERWVKNYFAKLKARGVLLDDDLTNVINMIINYSFTMNSVKKVRIIKKNINKLNKKRIGFAYFWEGLLLMIKDPYVVIIQNNINLDNVDQIIESTKLSFTFEGFNSFMDETIEIISGLYDFYLLDTFNTK